MPTFLSKHMGLRLTFKPAEMVDGRVVKPAKYIQFQNGRYATEDKGEIAFLRKHKDYGVSILEQDKTADELA